MPDGRLAAVRGRRGGDPMATDQKEAGSESQSSLRRALGRTTAMLLVAAVNYFGVKLNAKLLIALLFVQLALLAVFVVFAAPAVRAENLSPGTGASFAGILAGAAIFLWSWDGFMRMAIMASEVKEPRQTIPFAVVGGIAFAAVVFLVVSAAAGRPRGGGDEGRRVAERHPAPDRGPQRHRAVGDVGRAGGGLAGYAHRGARRPDDGRPGRAGDGKGARVAGLDWGRPPEVQEP